MRACSFVALSRREHCFDDLDTVKTFYQDADGLSVKSGAVCFCDSDHCNGYDLKSLEEKAKDGNPSTSPGPDTSLEEKAKDGNPRTSPGPDTSLEEKAKDGNQGNQPSQPRATPGSDASKSVAVTPSSSTFVAVTPSFIICASLILKVVW